MSSSNRIWSTMQKFSSSHCRTSGSKKIEVNCVYQLTKLLHNKHKLLSYEHPAQKLTGVTFPPNVNPQ